MHLYFIIGHGYSSVSARMLNESKHNKLCVNMQCNKPQALFKLAKQTELQTPKRIYILALDDCYSSVNH